MFLVYSLSRFLRFNRSRSEEEARKMSRVSLFNSPLLLGFEQIERTLDRVSKSGGEGYPPYNIEQIGDSGIRITIAVAGFSLDDLQVTVEDNQLVIRGRRQEEEDVDRVYLHRGIAARQFQRSFVLAEGIEVTGAHTDNGLLHVSLERPQVEAPVRTIKIEKGKKPQKNAINVAKAAE
jgi:HSP20 family molecular chaperone IbpA